MHKMTDLPQEECLKPDQLRSMTECERAIHAISEKTGKSPLDIWRANETWLGEKASTVDFKPDRKPLGIIILVIWIIVPYFFYASFRATGWYGFSAGILVLGVLMTIEIVCLMFMQKLLVPFGKILRSLSGVVFSIILTMFGFLSTLDSVANRFARSSPVEWCNRFVSFGVGYALSWSGGSSCWVGCGVSRDLVRMSRLR